jgi:hypothetical protein
VPADFFSDRSADEVGTVPLRSARVSWVRIVSEFLAHPRTQQRGIILETTPSGTGQVTRVVGASFASRMTARPPTAR